MIKTQIAGVRFPLVAAALFAAVLAPQIQHALSA